MSKYGALIYNNSYNLGDNIQTIAAMQYLPEVNYWIDRDTGDTFDSEYNIVRHEIYDTYKIKTIYNGWFDGQYCKFPHSINIEPLFISFHINETDHSSDIRYNILDKHKIEFKSIASETNYFKKYEPIGCRDLHTLYLLSKNKINSYFSACLTLTLNYSDYSDQIDQKKILVVDAHIDCPEIFEKYIPYKFINKFSVEYTMQTVEVQKSNDEKILLAKQLLRKIANARLVITSRLHTALPAMAFKVPVIFMNNDLDDVRFTGLLPCLKLDMDMDINDVSKKIEDYTWDKMNDEYGTSDLVNIAKNNIETIYKFVNITKN